MKEAAMMQRSFSLKLYKAILKAHRVKLPSALRELGDTYVRDEFKRHKTAQPEFLNSFFTQWLQCLAPDDSHVSLQSHSDWQILSL